MNILDYLRACVNLRARTLGADEEGATATEYVFLLILIAIIVGAAMATVGGQIATEFTDAGTSINTTN